MSADYFGFNTTQADTLARMKVAVAGGVSDGAVTTAKLGTASVTGAKLGAITSAELATAVSNETGTGALVFATSPTLVTPYWVYLLLVLLLTAPAYP